MITYQEVPSFRGATEIKLIRTQVSNPVAELAAELIGRFGLVAGCPDALEDSAGRAKLRLLTPEELVKRACDSAELAYGEFAKRGWLMEIPVPKLPTAP